MGKLSFILSLSSLLLFGCKGTSIINAPPAPGVKQTMTLSFDSDESNIANYVLQRSNNAINWVDVIKIQPSIGFYRYSYEIDEVNGFYRLNLVRPTKIEFGKVFKVN